MMPILHWSGVMTPGQFGPIRRVGFPSSQRLTRTMSRTGTPSVMPTTSGMPAAAASRRAWAAPAGGGQRAPVGLHHHTLLRLGAPLAVRDRSSLSVLEIHNNESPLGPGIG